MVTPQEVRWGNDRFLTALPSTQGAVRNGQGPIPTWLRDRTLREKVTEEGPELDGGKKNKQGH